MIAEKRPPDHDDDDGGSGGDDDGASRRLKSAWPAAAERWPLLMNAKNNV